MFNSSSGKGYLIQPAKTKLRFGTFAIFVERINVKLFRQTLKQGKDTLACFVLERCRRKEFSV